MSSAAPSRWTDGSMHKRVRRRYAAERRFRLVGLAAVSVSVLFLVFLLYTMAAKGLGGFTQFEAQLPINFAKSDLFLDPATLHGPDAEQNVAGADLEGAISKAAIAAYGPAAEQMFGDGAVRQLTHVIVDDPDVLRGGKGHDEISCGTGTDTVIASRGGDSVASDCERVVRR